MRKITLFLKNALLGIAYSACIPNALANTTELDVSMANALQKFTQTFKMQQVKVAVQLPNQQLLSFSNLTNNNLENEFAIASLTKTFTAVLIVQLAQQQQLGLNDTLSQYFKGYRQWNNITIAMLLNQTSGLPDYIDTPNFFDTLAKQPNHLYSPQELLQLAYARPFYFKPGTGWHYSNTNYLLLGLIAQQVTHQSLSQLYQNHFFNPFKLNNTYYFAAHFSKEIQSKFLPGFYDQHPATPNNMTWLQGAGGIISNLNDLILWGQALYQSPVLANTFAQIAAGMVSTTNGAPGAKNTTGVTYNAGVFRTNTPYGMMWYTPGLDSGYRNMLTFFPCQGLVVTYTMNNGDTRYSTHQVLLNLILTHLMADSSVKQVLGAYQSKVKQSQFCSLTPSKSFNVPLL